MKNNQNIRRWLILFLPCRGGLPLSVAIINKYQDLIAPTRKID
jgi:hypothetical protein